MTSNSDTTALEQALRREALLFVDDEEENVYGFDLVHCGCGGRDGNGGDGGVCITMAIADEMHFTIRHRGTQGRGGSDATEAVYEVHSSDPTLVSGGFLRDVAAYCAQGRKTLRDVLIRCTAAYDSLPDGDDTDTSSLSEDMEGDEDMDMDEDMEGVYHDPFAHATTESAAAAVAADGGEEAGGGGGGSVSHEEWEALRRRFDTNANSSSGSSSSAHHHHHHHRRGSPAAVSRLMRDYLSMGGGTSGSSRRSRQFGYSAHPIGDDLFRWEVRLFGFDPQEHPLARDLQQAVEKGVVGGGDKDSSLNSSSSSSSEADGEDGPCVTLEMTFPDEYPFKPPFIRVVRPRFRYLTGHVTIGGSICMELLTTSGWSPSNSIESILVQIRAELLAGGARVDFHNTQPYTEQEAREAFHRTSRRYGWE